MSSWVIVGISGVTNGGKSTLTKRLVETLPGHVRLINQDDYFYPEDSEHHVPAPGGLNHHNWDVLSSLNMDKLMKDVVDIVSSKPENLPSENLTGTMCNTNTSSTPNNSSNYSPVLLLDGFLLFDHKKLTNMCNLKYFLTLSHEQCKQRRDTRAYDPPDPEGYFDLCVWPMYEAHWNRVKKLSGIKYLNGLTDPYQRVFQEILAASRLPSSFVASTDDKIYK